MNNQEELFPFIAPKLTGKVCTKCKIEQPEENFYMSSGANFRRPECSSCLNKLDRVRRRLRRDYGNPPEDYTCPICEKTEDQITSAGKNKSKWAVDHCHKTDVFRGWLCHSCNKAIGLLYDKPEYFLRAIDYLKRST